PSQANISTESQDIFCRLVRLDAAILTMFDLRHDGPTGGDHPMSTPYLTQRLFIDGAFTEGVGTETFDVISPATGERVGTIPLPVQADLDAAVDAAHAAQRQWAAVNVWERAALCHRVGDESDKPRAQLARLQTREKGKPLAESVADVTETAELFRLHAEDAVRLHGETLPSRDNSKRMFTFHRAVGTWGII